MKKALVFEKQSGRCFSKIYISDNCIDNGWNDNELDFGVYFVDDSEDDCECSSVWFPGGLFTYRQKAPATISGLNVPADGETPVVLQSVAGKLSISGPNGVSEHDVADGPVELVFDTPGEYRIALDAFPYLPFEAVIHAY